MALVRQGARAAGPDAAARRRRLPLSTFLIRDAAYDGLPKAARAELHLRFAEWLDGHGSDLIELDEILGYHLEQAHRFRTSWGWPTSERRHSPRGLPTGSEQLASAH